MPKRNREFASRGPNKTKIERDKPMDDIPRCERCPYLDRMVNADLRTEVEGIIGKVWCGLMGTNTTNSERFKEQAIAICKLIEDRELKARIEWEKVWEKVNDNSHAYSCLRGTPAPYSYECKWVEEAVGEQLQAQRKDG